MEATHELAAILPDARKGAPQDEVGDIFTSSRDEVLNPHGEERGNAACLEPCGHEIDGHDSTQPEYASD
jgi:hypothetical protein